MSNPTHSNTTPNKNTSTSRIAIPVDMLTPCWLTYNTLKLLEDFVNRLLSNELTNERFHPKRQPPLPCESPVDAK